MNKSMEELILEYQNTGNIAIRNLILLKIKNLIAKYANQYRSNKWETEDLIGEGILGVIKAIDKFDYSKGYKFSTYAMFYIRLSIQTYVANNVSHVSCAKDVSKRNCILQISNLNPTMNDISTKDIQQFAKKLSISTKIVEDVLCSYTMSMEDFCEELIGDKNPINLIEKEDLINKIKDLFYNLTEIQQNILIERIFNEGKNATYKKISAKFNKNLNEVRKIFDSAIKQLRLDLN